MREARDESQLGDREGGGEPGLVGRDGVASQQGEPLAAAELDHKAGAAGVVDHFAAHQVQYFLAAEPERADPRLAGSVIVSE